MAVAGLDELAAAVVDATRPFGTPPADRLFRGHLTVARSRRDGFGGLIGTPVAVPSWPVRSVRIVRSTLGHGPPRYGVVDVVATRSLRSEC